MRCPKCSVEQTEISDPEKRGLSYKKYGSYRRKSDSRTIKRFYCKRCKNTYSHAVKDPAYYQKKRRVNHLLKCFFSSSVSLRRSAKLLGISRTTAARKLIFLGQLCHDEHQKYLEKIEGTVPLIQFDELQTIEHTKCKPLSVAMAVSVKDRKILGVSVAKMPATGHLAKISRKKYGFRADERQSKLCYLFRDIKKTLDKSPDIRSDKHPYYKPIVDAFFPTARYIQTRGDKTAICGQGELKKRGNDPLFYINHTLAMLRANINRLIRKTWCTTKDPARLLDHLFIYISVHNHVLTA